MNEGTVGRLIETLQKLRPELEISRNSVGNIAIVRPGTATEPHCLVAAVNADTGDFDYEPDAEALQ